MVRIVAAPLLLTRTLFWKPKTHLAGKKFSSNEEIIAAAAEGFFFADFEESVYKEGIAALQHVKGKDSPKVMVWCGLWDNEIVGPFFFDSTVTGEHYLRMLGYEMVSELHGIGYPEWFMQDGPPSH
ncbi:hypothetical protein ANN_16171 [Periplaneta americana]|uniref:Per a allergen n=1 Tax=Periplaneta americana TaxID=6978 RepID=A0ABQ8SI99_PERAM|nr:hypothetical protein ANN_16171 [Periplaneta americana]